MRTNHQFQAIDCNYVTKKSGARRQISKNILSETKKLRNRQSFSLVSKTICHRDCGASRRLIKHRKIGD